MGRAPPPSGLGCSFADLTVLRISFSA